MTIISYIFLFIGLFFFFASFGYQMIGLLFIFLSIMIVLFKKYKKLFWSLLSIVCPLLLLIEIPIVCSAHSDLPPNTDYLIVLGAGVNGTTPSLSLLDRLEATTEYLRAHPDCMVIVSGGQGTGEDISEAEAMQLYLLNQGIPAKQIIKEDQARNTIENIAYSYQLIPQQNHKPIVAIVSSEYHIFRSKLIARELGYDVYALAAPTSNWLLKINYFLREAPALVKTWFMLL